METTGGQPAPGNPYVGPRAFSRGETIYGRGREIQRLLHLLIAERIVVLYSPSGAGKTSLIQAGLIPRLEQEDFAVLPVVRVSLEPPASTPDGQTSEVTPNRYVQSVILSLEEGQPPEQRLPLTDLASLDLATYLDRRCTSTANDGPSEWVLMFDQFEEILTIDPTDEADKMVFFAQVGAALRDRRFWALFTLREDYLAGLDPYLRPIPTRLHTTFRLDMLGPEAARLAIQQPARAAGVEFQDTAAERLIDDLRRVRVQQLDGGMRDQLGTDVEPVQLQVVCRRLWERLPTATTRIVESDIEAVGDVDQALAGYYAERAAGAAAHTGVPERTIREWIDRQLITEQGIRGQVLQGQEQSEGLPNAAILALVDAHLVRAERRRGFTWFELAHDRLIRPIRADNATWYEQHLSDLQRQAALWERHDRQPELLLRGNAYRDVVSWASVHDTELTSVERDFLSAAREVDEAAARDRRRVQWIQRLAIGAALLAVLSTAASIVAWQFQMQAVQQTEIANQQTETATLRGLFSEARQLYQSRLDQALLVSLEAMNRSHDTPLARGTLLDALNAEPRLDGFLVGHTQRVLRLAFTGGGHSGLISIGTDTSPDLPLRVWDVPDLEADQAGQQRGAFAVAVDATQPVAFSPDGAFLATMTGTPGNRLIHLWSLQQNAEVKSWAPGQRADAMAFSYDSTRLGTVGPSATGSSTAQVKLWSVPDGQPQGTHNGPGPAPNATSNAAGPPTRWPSLAFGNDGTGGVVAFGANNGEVAWLKLYGSSQSSQRLEPQAVSITVTSLAFSPGGQYLVEGTSGADVYLWDMRAGGPAKTLKGHKLGVTSVAFDSVAKFDPVTQQKWQVFATASVDGTIILWDAGKAQPFATPPLAGHPTQVDTVAFSPDGTKLASAGLDGPIRVWNVPADQGAFVVEAAPLGTRLQNPTRGQGMTALAFDLAGERLAGLYRNRSIVVWNTSIDPAGHVDGSSILPAIPTQSGTVAELAFSPDGRVLATAGCETQVGSTNPCQRGVVRFWDTATHQPTREPLFVDGTGLESAAFDPGANSFLLVAGDAMGRLHTWNLADASPLDTMRATHGQQPIRGLRFSQDGALLVSAATDGILLWHTPDLSQIPDHPIVDTVSSPNSVALSPNRALLASVSASDDRLIDVWDLANGQATQRGPALTGILATVHGLAFVDDRTLASISADATVRLWDVTNPTGVQIGQPLRGYPFDISALAYSPTKKRLATSAPNNLSGVATVNNNLILWQVQRDSWWNIACHIAGHNLSTTDWPRLMGDLPYDGSLCPRLPVIPEGP